MVLMSNKSVLYLHAGTERTVRLDELQLQVELRCAVLEEERLQQQTADIYADAFRACTQGLRPRRLSARAGQKCSRRRPPGRL